MGGWRHVQFANSTTLLCFEERQHRGFVAARFEKLKDK